MLSRAWLRYSALVVCLLLLAAALANVGSGVLIQYYNAREGYQKDQDRSDARRQKAANEIADRCSIIVPMNPALRDCLAQQIRAYQEKTNTEQDLQAQQDMAYWAGAMFWITGASTLVGVIGLCFLYMSLGQTRQAISTDREVGHAQVRAYLSVVPVNAFIRVTGSTPFAIYKIRNNGGTPAYRVRHVADVDFLPYPLPDSQGDLVLPVPRKRIPEQTLQSQADFRVSTPRQTALTSDETKELETEGGRRIYLFGVIMYEDVFRTEHKTWFCYAITNSGGITTTSKGPRDYPASFELSHVHNHAD